MLMQGDYNVKTLLPLVLHALKSINLFLVHDYLDVLCEKWAVKLYVFRRT